MSLGVLLCGFASFANKANLFGGCGCAIGAVQENFMKYAEEE